MAATAEQQLVINEILKPKCTFLKVSACSGSGKTFTLVELVKALVPKNGLYIAYNKAIATEASGKFPSTVQCCTTHSLAWRATVRQFGLKVGYFGYRDIKAKMPYERKLTLVDAIEEFCLSGYTSFTDFINASETYSHKLALPGENILTEMSTGVTTCTHAFYLKLYHMLLINGDVDQKELDVLLLDEAGDLNEVTLQIFLALPAKKKVMVGDPNQNIYSFNNTINGFEILRNVGTQLGLTNSFRVSREIAYQVELFARDTFDENMQFRGITYDNNNLDTYAYISRTNGQLIARMMELNLFKTPYNLVRPVKSIFALPMAIIGLKQGGKILNPQHKFLQDDTDDYYKSRALQREYKSPMAYIESVHSENASVKSAISMIHAHGPRDLIEAKDIALKYESSKTTYPLTVCTSHSSKGLEFDSVEIGDDTNQGLSKILALPKKEWEPKHYEEMRLFYVAATRARKELLNAKHLEKYAALAVKLTATGDS